jgi:arginine utilization protein RocB
MSFLGQADTADVALIAANTPAWDTGVRWIGEVCGVPTVNIGPWGRDYHTPLERIHTPYAFEALPLILNDVSRRLLEPAG